MCTFRTRQPQVWIFSIDWRVLYLSLLSLVNETTIGKYRMRCIHNFQAEIGGKTSYVRIHIIIRPLKKCWYSM